MLKATTLSARKKLQPVATAGLNFSIRDGAKRDLLRVAMNAMPDDGQR